MANEVERVVVELLARVDGFDGKIRQSASSFGGAMKQVESSAGRAEKATTTSLAKVDRALARTQHSSRQLGFQINDIGTQIAAGTSPFLVLAQQGNQVASALEGSKGKLGAFAAFLGTGWGAALLTATSLFGIFIGKLLEGGDSVDELVGKLKKEAQAAEDGEKANTLFARSIEGVTKAADDAEKAVEALRLAKKGEAEQTAESIQKNLDEATTLRETTRARLAEARALYEIQKQRAKGGTQGSDLAAIGLGGRIDTIQRLEKELKDADTAAARLQASLNKAVSYRTVDRLNVSEEEAANRKYDAQIDAKAALADASAASQRALEGEIKAINIAREAELKRIRDTNSARKKSPESTLPKVTGKEIAAALGAPIISGKRTVAQNKAAGGAANSFHLSDQAIDIPLSVNGKPLTKEGIRAALEPLGVAIKELLGPGDKGHSDHFHIAFDKKRREPDDIASARSKALEDAERDAARFAEAQIDRRRKVENEEAGLDAQILQQKQSVAESAAAQAALEIQAIDQAEQRYAAEIDALVKEYQRSNGLDGIVAADAEILKKKRAEVAELERQQVQQREQARIRQENLRIATDLLNNDIELLRSEEDVATTQKDRRRIALAIVDAEYAKLDATLRSAIAEGEAAGLTEAALAPLRQRLANLTTLKANAVAGTTKDTAGPLESYIGGIRETAADLDSAFEEIAAGSLQDIVNGLGQAAAGFTSLGDVGRQVLGQLTAALVKLAIQQLILKTIGDQVGDSASQTASASGAAAAGANAASAATIAQAAAVAAAWAPAAAAASLATLGSNAGPAIGALIATHAASLALSAVGALAGGAIGRKDGGRIFGPGGPRDDKVMMFASPNEWVINARSAAKVGHGTLDYINRTGELPAFRDGGRIGSINPVNMSLPPAGGGRGGFSPDDIRELKGVLADAAAMMPNVSLYPTLSPKRAMEAMLSDPGSQRLLFDFMSNNSGSINSNLRR